MSVCQRDRFPCRTTVVARNVPRPDFAIQLALLLLALSSLPSLSPPNLDILAHSKLCPLMSLPQTFRKLPAMIVELDICCVAMFEGCCAAEVHVTYSSPLAVPLER